MKQLAGTAFAIAAGAVSIVALVLFAALPGRAQEVTRPAENDCAMCHDDVGAALELTPHGGTAFALVPGAKSATNHCVNCHGEADEHIEEADPDLIELPQGEAAYRMCLTCHDAQLHTPMLGATAHASQGVFCLDCHDVHPDDAGKAVGEPRLLRREQVELCSECHTQQVAQFRRPNSHRLGHGGMACTSCHDPHAGRGERSLAVDRLGAGPCEGCHTEKRGPFVFPHVTQIVGNCLSCHEPHGSNNAKQLTRHRVDQLCLECHAGVPSGFVGSQPPSFHNTRSPRFQNCTSCHVAIHGSNSSPVLLK